MHIDLFKHFRLEKNFKHQKKNKLIKIKFKKTLYIEIP